jgi:hypothetical protein
MTTLTDLFPSPYLAASDVESRPVVTIKTLTRKSMKNREGEEEVKPVLFFNEFEKGMVLNKTNADIIGSLLGSTIEDWYGERVQLYSVMVEAFGKRQPAIRVMEQKPRADKSAILERYQKLWERGKAINLDGIEDYVVSPDMTEQELIALGKELKGKIESAELFA